MSPLVTTIHHEAGDSGVLPVVAVSLRNGLALVVSPLAVRIFDWRGDARREVWEWRLVPPLPVPSRGVDWPLLLNVVAESGWQHEVEGWRFDPGKCGGVRLEFVGGLQLRVTALELEVRYRAHGDYRRGAGVPWVELLGVEGGAQ